MAWIGPDQRRQAPYGVLPEIKSEEEFTELVTRQLAQHFEVTREVWGTHPIAGRLRIDAILAPKDGAGWPDGTSTALGVEFKDPTGDKTGRLIAQCSDYAVTRWDCFGMAHVFACPAPSYNRFGRSNYVGQSLTPHWDAVTRKSTEISDIVRTLNRHRDASRISAIESLAGLLHVGFLHYSQWRGWSMRREGIGEIWSQQEGVRPAASRLNFVFKFGSR